MQVLAQRRDASRERLIFDDDTVELLAVNATAAGQSSRRQALVDCLARLPADRRELIRARYVSDESTSSIAARTGRTAASVSMLLYRVRQKLLDCIQGKLQESAA